MEPRRLTRLLAVCLTFLLWAAPAAALENLRVAYPSVNTSVFALMIAQKEGYFKEEGLNVELLSIRGEIAIRTTLAGDVDFFTNAGSALAAAVRSVPVKILTVFQDKPAWELIAQPNIKSIAQLRGATVAIMSPEGSLAIVTREILRRNGLDPAKDVNLVVMGGDSVRFPALKGRAIQATLFNVTMSIRAQKEGFMKLAVASDYANLIQGGLATSDEKIKQNSARIHRFIRASLKGAHFFVSKREAAIRTMMEALRMTDRDLAGEIYDAEAKLLLRDGVADDKLLQAMIEEMRKTTKVQRGIRLAEVFDLSFARKAGDDLKASGWRP